MKQQTNILLKENSHTNMKQFIFLFTLLLLPSISFAQKLSLGELFNEGAVLQRQTKVLIWGNCAPNTSVSIAIQGKVSMTKSDLSGKWSCALSPLKEGGPYSLTAISGKDTLKLKEIFVGEVWIAGGQSNMGWTLEKSIGGVEEASKASNKDIRFVIVPFKSFDKDKDRGDMKWRTATAENGVGAMSGVAYFYAKQLQQKLKVPIGIICCYKGGSGAETWMTRDWLLKTPETKPIVDNYEKYLSTLGITKYDELYADYETKMRSYRDSIKAGNTKVVAPKEPMGPRHFNRPYGLYHTMLERVVPYTLKGAIWYQGEHNSSRAAQYRTLFPLLIEEWRSDFRNAEMPFYFVQLANYANADATNRPIWPEQREAQLLTWLKVKNTGMVVSMDIGEKETIHPPRKEPVGNRLAAIAFDQTYHIPTPYSGPIFKAVTFNGNKAVISFNFTYNGLKSDGELKGFTICGADKQFVTAKAILQNNQITVYAEGVTTPIAVRYGWTNWSDGNLCNSAELPASPFRTDDFPMLTSGRWSDSYTIPKQ